MANSNSIARLAGALAMAVAVFVLPVNTAQAITIESGDFVDEVGRLKGLAFAKDSDLYVPPSAAEQAAFSALATSLLAGDLANADTQAAALDYELVEFTDTVSGAVYHGLREIAQTRGWGSYFLNLSSQSEALVQTPHIIFDTNSWEVGAKAFRQSAALGFLMSGAHRNANGQGTADVAHLAESIFQEVHEAWNGGVGETTAWQVHGYNEDNHSSFPTGSDAVLSNGDGGISQEVIDLDALLEAQAFDSYAYNTLDPSSPLNMQVNDGEPGTNFSSLAGTTNVQGIHSRGLGGTFVHVELEQSIRFDALNRDIAATAIADAISDQLDTIPPLLVSADALDQTSVSVSFSEDLDPATATDEANYTIDNGVTVNLAVLSSDGQMVILDTTALADGVVNTLTVNNVEDVAGNPVAANSETQFEYQAPVAAHVSAIDMELSLQGKRWRRAQATVTVLDGSNQPVVGATVSGAWTGLTSQNVSGVTATNGAIALISDKVSATSGEFIFTVTNVAADGYTYDSAGNVESSDCITADNLSCDGGDPGDPGDPPPDPPGDGSGTVRGIVQDQNGTKLANATVATATLSDQTGRNGRYRINEVPAGTPVDVSASLSGCTTVVFEGITVAADQTVTLDFTGPNSLDCN